MQQTKLKNVRVVDKPERGRFEDRDLYEKSSNITVYNVFDQDWKALESEGLAHLFKNEADFNGKKAEHNNQTNEKGDN